MSSLPLPPGRVFVARPDIDENRSVWMQGYENAVVSPLLQGQTTADVVIIGGGFTGISTAWHLSRRFPQKRIVLLEAKRIGNGASGRNGGQLLNWINGVDHDDPALTTQTYQTTQRGIDQVISLIRTEKLDVPYRMMGSFEWFTDSRRAEAAQKEVERLNSWGIPLRWVGQGEIGRYTQATGVVGGIYDPGTGMLHGVALLQAMRAKMPEVAIYEHSPVLQITEGRQIRVKTPQGEVVANAMVLATNGYTPRLGYFRHTLFPLHTHAIATAAQSSEDWAKAGWGPFTSFCDDRDRISYGGISPAGSLIFGGGGNAAYAYRWGNATSYPEASAKRGHDFVTKRLHHYMPNIANLPIQYRWTGTLGITMDRCCAMGVMGEYQNVYYALGYSGHGVTLANLAGEVLCDLYSGDHARWKDQPFYNRRLLPIPGEPFRYVGYHLYTWLTGRSPRKRK